MHGDLVRLELHIKHPVQSLAGQRQSKDIIRIEQGREFQQQVFWHLRQCRVGGACGLNVVGISRRVKQAWAIEVDHVGGLGRTKTPAAVRKEPASRHSSNPFAQQVQRALQTREALTARST